MYSYVFCQMSLVKLLDIYELSNKIAYNESVFAMAGYSLFRHADTEVD